MSKVYVLKYYYNDYDQLGVTQSPFGKQTRFP